MTPPPGRADGIDIHYDAQRRELSLACEPDAFEPFRSLARRELSEMPGIDLDKVITIEVTNVEAEVARIESAQRWWHSAAFISLIGAFFVVAYVLAVGIINIVKWFLR